MGAKVQRAAAAAAAEAATAAAAAERGRLAIVEKKRAALMEEKHAQQVEKKEEDDESHFPFYFYRVIYFLQPLIIHLFSGGSFARRTSFLQSAGARCSGQQVNESCRSFAARQCLRGTR
jgi:hypothetical protein